MKNKKPPLPEHVIRAMRRDDGYIITEASPKGGLQYAVYVLTTDGYKSLCTISFAEFKQLHDDGMIKHVGDGKWKLIEEKK